MVVNDLLCCFPCCALTWTLGHMGSVVVAPQAVTLWHVAHLPRQDQSMSLGGVDS